MKRVKFQTEKGKIEFFIGNSYVLTSIDPDDSEFDTQTETYIGTDGETEIESLYRARTVTVKGYITAQNQAHLERLKRNMIRLLNGKDTGTLTLISNGNEFFAESRAESLPSFGDVIQNMQSFICYFKIPSFYWKRTDKRGNVKQVYKRINMITQDVDISNGVVLTKRISEGSIVNNGDTAGDMIITIVCNFAGTSSESGSVIIENLTTGEKMTVKHKLVTGEKIIINTETSSIKSYVNGTVTNILHKLEGDFIKLPVGSNVIKVTNNNEDADISLTVEYYDKLAGVGIC